MMCKNQICNGFWLF